PRRCSVCSTAERQPSSVLRSATTGSIPPPSSASSCPRRATAATRTPAAQSCSAVSRPMPLDAPVTRAILLTANTLRGMDVAYQVNGSGPRTVVLANALGSTTRVWEPQWAALEAGFRVVRYDHRGHGATPPGEPVQT